MDEDRWVTREPGQYFVSSDYVAAIDVPDKALFVATESAEVIGNLRLRCEDGEMHLGMMVRKDYRHRGIGGKLLDAALDWAREQGLPELFLTVYAHNPGIALYRNKGFRQADYRRGHCVRRNGEVWDLVVMVRALP